MKKWVKGLLACSFGACMIVAGCSGPSDVKNESESIIYNGGAVVSVGDMLFYANGFASGVDGYSSSNNSEYNSALQYSGLSRVKADTTFTEYESAKEVQYLSTQMAGFANMYTFVLGDFLYYVAPDNHKDNQNQYTWTGISVRRCRLNGKEDGEIARFKSYNASKGQVVALEYEGAKYLVVFDGTKITRITLGDSCAVKELSDKATTVALPNEGESWNGDIYFTKAKEGSKPKGNLVSKINIKTEEEKTYTGTKNETYSFSGRVGDDVYVLKTPEAGSAETFKIDVANLGEQDFCALISNKKAFYSGTISDIQRISADNAGRKGVIFSVSVDNKKQLYYYNEVFDSELYKLTEEFSNILFVYGDNVYYSNDSSISYINVNTSDNFEEQKIVSNMTIKSGFAGYDFNYADGEIASLANIYFYAQRQYSEEQQQDEKFDKSDENSYLYSITADGSGKVKLVGKTK